jgi:hypothetical protein
MRDRIKSGPVGVSLQEIHHNLWIYLPPILTIWLPPVPAWHAVRPTCDSRLVSHVRGITYALAYRRHFKRNSFPIMHTTRLYILKDFLFKVRPVVPSSEMSRISSRLHRHNTVNTAEIHGITWAIVLAVFGHFEHKPQTLSKFHTFIRHGRLLPLASCPAVRSCVATWLKMAAVVARLNGFITVIFVPHYSCWCVC